jgi:tetratricopeptide (TPR) repeat protein
MDPPTRLPIARCRVALAGLIAVCTIGCAGVTSGPSAPPAAATPVPSATSPPATAAPPMTSSPAPVATTSPTAELIAFLAEQVAADPGDAEAQLQLGLAYLQRVRETADPSGYAPAETALQVALRLLPGDPRPLVGVAGLQLSRHEFPEALETARSALALDPLSPGALAAEFDALIETGAYDEAFTRIDQEAATASDLPTLARLSYARELRGDLDGAVEAMRRAAEVPGLPAENGAFAATMVGHLERLRGRPDDARAAYDDALLLVPDHVPALAGLGRLAVARGDLLDARARFERAVAVLPLAEHAISLGDVLAASGDPAAADAQYDLARFQLDLLEAAGARIDQDAALIEADHGDPARAVKLAEDAFTTTPTIKAADALAWALHRAGRDQEAWPYVEDAARLGTPDPAMAYHRGVIAQALDRRSDAIEGLTRALALDPGFSATAVADTRERLQALGAPVPPAD